MGIILIATAAKYELVRTAVSTPIIFEVVHMILHPFGL